MRDGVPVTRPQAPDGPRRLAWLVVLAIYVALSLYEQRTLLPGIAHDVYAQAMLGNDCLLHVWTLAWDHHALATQPCALFDANIFHPETRTLLYSDHLLGLAVLLAPLRLLTDNALLVHNLATLAAPVLDALAAYALAWELGRRRTAAFVAGLVYGFAPLRFAADRCQIQMLVAWWLPLVLLFARRAIVRGRVADACLAGVALALQGLSGVYLTAYFLPFLALAHVLWLRRYPPRAHRRGWTALVLAELAAVAVLVPPSLAYRAVQAELGTTRALYTNALLSLQLEAPPGNVSFSTLPTLAPWVTLPSLVPVLTLATLVGAALLLWRRLPRDLALEGPLFVAIALGGLVLALGPILPVPGGGAVPGPYRLLLLVPGFDALRAPGRFVHVALLGAAILSAGAIVALGDATTRWGRAALLLGVLGALAIESVPPEPMPTIRAPDRAADAPITGWLARHRTSVRAMLLPVDAYGLSAAMHQYTTTWHWAPVVNGSSGIVPPMYPFVLREIDRFPDDDVVADLRALGATHVVAQLARMRPLRDGRLDAALARPHPSLKRVLAHRGTVVLAIRPRLRPAHLVMPGPHLDRSRWTATASHAAGQAGLAIDADVETYWGSWSDLEAGLRRWYQPVPFMERVAAFDASLPVRLEIDFGEPILVSALEIRLAGTDALLMPNVAVELSSDGDAWQPIGRLQPMPTIRGLVEYPRVGRVGVRFDAPVRARRLRLLGTGLEMRVADVRAYGP